MLMAIFVIVCFTLNPRKQSNEDSQNSFSENDRVNKQDILVSDQNKPGQNDELEEEYMQLSTWKAGSGTELLETNKIFLFNDYALDEYKTMIAAASYGRSSAGEYVILEYYEADRGLLGYIVRIREIKDDEE